MAFWSKKKIIDSINKYFSEKKVTLKNNNSMLEFELYFSNGQYTLYPYIKINEDLEEVSIVVNIKKVSDISLQLNSVNSFNLKSKYFTAKVNEEGILFLEYNFKANYDIASKALDKAIESLYSLSSEIDNL